jgi:WD40 repeat protein
MSVAPSSDGSRIASCGNDGTVRIWDAARGVKEGEPWQGHESVVLSVVGAEGSRIVWAGTTAWCASGAHEMGPRWASLGEVMTAV